MFNENPSIKRKKRKKSIIFCYNVLIILIIVCILVFYKIYISAYLKNNIHISLRIKSLEKYIPYLKEIYYVLFNKYQLQIVIPLILIYNYCNIYKTFILLIFKIYYFL